MEIRIKELLRARDVTLIKFICPICNQEQLTGVSPVECPQCRADLSNYIFDLNGCNKRNIIAITKKIIRRKISKKEVIQMLKSQDFLCMYCYLNLKEREYHVDHIVPLAAGGTNNASNLCISCPDCNLKASSKIFRSLYDKRIYIQKTPKYNKINIAKQQLVIS